MASALLECWPDFIAHLVGEATENSSDTAISGPPASGTLLLRSTPQTAIVARILGIPMAAVDIVIVVEEAPEDGYCAPALDGTSSTPRPRL